MTGTATRAPAVAQSLATHRERIVAAAIELTETEGWSSVTMARIADHVHVSRQTVYNEIGSKPELAEAMVLDELARFLAVVDRAFEEQPDDCGEAIRQAVRGILRMAEGHALLGAIVASSHGSDSDLLPLLTTRSLSLMTVAKSTLTAHLAPSAAHLTRRQADAVVDVVVRAVLSHVMQPSATPERTSDDVAWIAGRLLARAV